MRIATLYLVTALTLLLTLANAVTVTLTGTCSAALVNGSVLRFTLSNSGNGTANNLIIHPQVWGTQSNATYDVASIGPKGSATINFPITEKLPGSYVALFTTAYQQDGSSFVASFPCSFHFQDNATSAIYLKLNVSKLGNGKAVAELGAFNGGPNTVTANISVASTPIFTITPLYRTAEIGPYGYYNTTFNVSYPTESATYIVSAIADYQLNRINYASLAIGYLFTGSSPPGILTLLPLIAGIVIVAILMLLLARVAIMRSKLKKRKVETQGV